MTKRTTRLLIVDDIHPVFAEKLTANHIAFDYLPTIGKEEALQVIHQYSGLVIRSQFKVDAAFLDAAPRLTFIARGGAGMDRSEAHTSELQSLLRHSHDV